MSSEKLKNLQIRDFAQVKGGKRMPSGTALTSEKTTHPYLRIVDFKDGSINPSGLQYVPESVFPQISRYVISSDDLYISIVGTIGLVGSVPSFLSGANLTENAAKICNIDGTKINRRYLSYYLRSGDGQRAISSLTVGSTQPKLALFRIEQIEVPAPSLDVQEGIADVLSALDDRITLLRETNATLEAIAQALFKSWFVDFDPVRAKMEGRVPEGMDEATAALFPDSFEQTELGEVPRGWHTDFIAPWLSVLETGRRPKGGVSGISDGIPSIGAESIVKVGQFDFSKLKFVSAEFFTAMKSGRLTSRDVLLYKDGGKPGVFLPRVSMFGDGFPFDVCGINEHVFRIRLKEPFGQVFLYFWLWSDSVMHELKHRGGKAAIPGINQADVKELRLSVPSAAVLRRFEEICDPIVGQILNNAKRMQSLASLRDELLPRLISGQLRIPEAVVPMEVTLA